MTKPIQVACEHLENAPREGDAPAEPSGDERVTLPQRLGGSLALPEPAHLQRRHPVHGIKYVDGQPTIIFDTLCIKHRRPVLACQAFHQVFQYVAASAAAWLMGRYVIMPDHIHFFAGDVGGDIPYERWVTYLKSQLTKHYAPGRSARGRSTMGGRPKLGGRRSRGAESELAPPSYDAARQEPRPPEGDLRDFRWLTDHWDVRVRNAQIYEDKWLYVFNNPVRKGLVAKAEDWPYQGEIHQLRGPSDGDASPRMTGGRRSRRAVSG